VAVEAWIARISLNAGSAVENALRGAFTVQLIRRRIASIQPIEFMDATIGKPADQLVRQRRQAGGHIDKNPRLHMPSCRKHVMRATPNLLGPVL